MIIVLIFFGLLLLPQAADKFFDLNRSTAAEKRNLTPFPQEFKYRKIAVQLEEYYNDRIPFRPVLLNGCRKLQSALFPFTLGNTLIGKKDFYFFRKPGWEDPVDQFRGKEKLRQHDLLEAQKFLKKLNAYLEHKHIPFLLVIAPNKVQIYPEYLPERRKYTESPLMPDLQLVAFMQKHSPEIPILHLRQTVLEAKKYYGDDLFYRLDTHWGPVGGYVGARKVIRHFAPDSQLPAPGEFKVTSSNINEPIDLINQSLNTKTDYVKYPEIKPLVPEFTGKFQRAAPDCLYSFNPNAPDKRRVMMHRESFAIAMMPYLSEHFREVYYIWSHKISRKRIEEIAPDIFILEYVARIIGRMQTKLR